MGLLVKGVWHTDWYETKSDDPAKDGEFIREGSQFRQWVGRDMAYPAEAGRYHLFVSLACPWAHRTLIMRALKQLEDVIGVTAVKPEMLDKGWEIDDQVSLDAGYEASPVEADYMHQIYSQAQLQYSGRVTVPVLWDKKTRSIVNNESGDILRMLNSAFDEFTAVKTDYYPQALRTDINVVNDFIYDAINNGVYKVGFATTQPAYERNFHKLFAALDEVEATLTKQRYLVGDQITEADWRLFTTLIRFDAVYHGHFKTNLKRIEDYPNMANYVRELYQQPGVADTVNFDHIKTHYYASHDTINPTGIVPLGPEIDYTRVHNRHTLFQLAA